MFHVKHGPSFSVPGVVGACPSKATVYCEAWKWVPGSWKRSVWKYHNLLIINHFWKDHRHSQSEGRGWEDHHGGESRRVSGSRYEEGPDRGHGPAGQIARQVSESIQVSQQEHLRRDARELFRHRGTLRHANAFAVPVACQPRSGERGTSDDRHGEPHWAA